MRTDEGRAYAPSVCERWRAGVAGRHAVYQNAATLLHTLLGRHSSCHFSLLLCKSRQLTPAPSSPDNPHHHHHQLHRPSCPSARSSPRLCAIKGPAAPPRPVRASHGGRRLVALVASGVLLVVVVSWPPPLPTKTLYRHRSTLRPRNSTPASRCPRSLVAC